VSRHVGMLCEECNVVESVRDGTGLDELDFQILTDAEREQYVDFMRRHRGHRGAVFCLFDVQNLAEA
jgi:hypothetical protein